MSKPFLLLLLGCLTVSAALVAFQQRPEVIRLRERATTLIQPLRDRLEELFSHRATPAAGPRQASERIRPTLGAWFPHAQPGGPSHRATSAQPAPSPAPFPNGVTLYLKNGGIVSGTLAKETPREVVLQWEYGEAAFARSEVERIVRAIQDTDGDHITMPWEGEAQRIQWPYQHDVVAKLATGTILDAEMTDATPQRLLLTQQVSGGGVIEHTVARAQLEQVLFRPIRNARSQLIEQRLRTLFPAMRWEREGFFTIVTDSPPPTVKAYRRAIQDLATDWYLMFAPLVRGRAPMVQQHVVVFEHWESYMEYALTDGVPGWLAVGYFQPEDQVLYCFNMVGERFSELLEQAYLGQFREARDAVSSQIKGSRYELFVEGQISEFLQKLEQAHAIVRQLFQRLSIEILRHELTHALFHNWRLQTITLSQLPVPDPSETEQKRRFLETQGVEEKRKLLDELLAQRSLRGGPEVQATNAWFVEGLAGFMESSPVGAVNHQRLADLQEALRTRHLIPLEFLHTFRLGSFSGMTTESQLYAYAQSWAFCHFLLARHRAAFLSYLGRIASASSLPAEGEDRTLPWLLEALGLQPQALEEEFSQYVAQLPHEDPFWLRQMQIFLDLRFELIALANRLN